MTIQSYQQGSLSARALELLIFAAIGLAFVVLAPRSPVSVPTVTRRVP